MRAPGPWAYFHTRTHARTHCTSTHCTSTLLQKRLNAELQSKHEVMLEALVAERTYVDGKVAIVVGKLEQVRKWAYAVCTYMRMQA